MTKEQQKILDKLYAAWQQTQSRQQALINQLAEAERDGLIMEAKFKGVLEAFGGENWEWKDNHIQFIKTPLSPKSRSGKIPGE